VSFIIAYTIQTVNTGLKECVLERCQWLIPVILVTWEVDIRRLFVRPAQTNSSQDPISKTQHKKRLVEWLSDRHLPSKCEALSSNPITLPLQPQQKVCYM
jgi:hypothetical protein